MTARKKPQMLKPSTAAKKLGIHLPATPDEFREGTVSREEMAALLQNPPQWLTDLRAQGPHPRPVVAEKLGVSIAGLARAGVDEVLTTEQIDALLADRPEWLRAEREVQAGVRAENRRISRRRDAE
ncbi:DUF5997 family protein [Tomitella fengzijianii]|uniref:Uncharacterized protein n=1 Tax=Tomitella fengzijianii TaxID=2597660 RepID=A0A516X3H0_9ACTN|nr:DUF5997 family protein [Tomitella fengzijianii]QDQ97618.1 hypothetical protein FO059_10145 [Tomitella fengzijianii]